MTKDFNGELFSAIIKANEQSLQLLEKQLEEAKEVSKRNDKKFYITIIILSLLLGGMVWAYANKKVEVDVNYDQQATENTLTDSTASINKIE